MMLLKYSAAVAALALCGQVNASRCKPDPRSTTTDLETSSTAQTSATETSSTTTEVSSSTTASLSTESSTSDDATSSSILTSETSTSASDSTTLVVSTTTESSTIDTTTTDLLSTTTTDASTTTEASTTTDVSTTETSTTSAAPQCTFAGEYSNYVRNPSFDDKDSNGQYTADPWTFDQGNTVEASQARTGQNAVAYQYPFPPYNQAIRQRLQDTVAGQEYALRYYWALIEGSPSVTDYCRIGSSAGPDGQAANYIFNGDQVVVDGEYYMFETRIKASEDNQRLGIGFFCVTDRQVKIHIDDIAVYDYYEGCDGPSGGGD
ncbi:hypothetical protein FALBO_164 [Fusarium albosuccineum]|uniref:Uncharacterized protein n=1 Tax=Fusarium albosuccineum TaxID=1237068 RepID=A0A8H4LRN8_9HYPO|nr:hypothetical protein FALBO_164 [Fusarium albosuccineum]